MKNLLFVIIITLTVFYNCHHSQHVEKSKVGCQDTLLITSELSRQNIVYIGMYNPLKIKTLKHQEEEIEVTGTGVEIEKEENGKYIITATRPGNGKINIKIGDYQTIYNVRVKRIPRPWVMLGNHESGTISKVTFKAQSGIGAWITNFDVDAKCKMVSFQLTRITKDGEQETIENIGGRFTETAQKIINKAQSGDIYLFEELRYRCPGDTFEKGRKDVNSLVFRIE